MSDELKNMILESLPEEPKEEIQEEQETPEEPEELEEEPKEEESDEPKVDRNFQGRINYLVKKQKEAEERALAAERALKDKESEAERLKQQAEFDGEEFDSVDDLLEHVNKNYVSRSDLEAEIRKFRDEEAQAEQQMKLQEVAYKFQDLIAKEYKTRYDQTIGAFDDEAAKEINQIGQLFQSNPELWIGLLESKGAKGVLAFIRGEEQSHRKQSPIEAKKKLETETSSAPVRPKENTKKETDLKKLLLEAVKTAK